MAFNSQSGNYKITISYTATAKTYDPVNGNYWHSNESSGIKVFYLIGGKVYNDEQGTTVFTASSITADTGLNGNYNRAQERGIGIATITNITVEPL